MNEAINQNNIISSDEAIALIEASVKTLLAHPEQAHTIPPILLRGAPGVGKSSIVKHVADSLGIGFVDVRLAQLERVDICGLPNVENGTTKWNVPSFLPRDPNSKGILFFDEITAAPSDCQVAAYSMVLDRMIPNSDYKIPDGWFIVAAGNRKEDKSVAKTLSAALANRFAHFTVEANVEDWIKWAVMHDINPSVTGFIQYRPDNLFKMENQNVEAGWPSPRTWERVSSIIPIYEHDETLLQKMTYALVGNAVGVEFMAFYKIQSKFDDVLEMLTNPNAEIHIPKETDRKYAMCSAVSYLLWNGKDQEDIKRRISGMYRILMKLTADFATMCCKTCMQGNSKINRMQASMMIIQDPAYKAFAAKFGDEFAKHHTLD